MYRNVTKKTSLFMGKTTNITGRMNIIFATPRTTAKLAGPACGQGTLRRTIGQTGTPTLQDRGYVQAVEENA
ncbi:MAG: hypothetical protein E7I52_23060, partial [Klebsiella michiganensis]|nr:hypothetical protein [Klebsiella michiganensis]MDU7373188.1 hypothetical protein [Klebsiella michiganensis]